MKLPVLFAVLAALSLAFTACGDKDEKDDRTKRAEDQKKDDDNKDSNKATGGNKGSKKSDKDPDENKGDTSTTTTDTPPPVDNPAPEPFCGEFTLSNAESTDERPWAIDILTAKAGESLQVELDGGQYHRGTFTMQHEKVGNVDNYEFSWQGPEHGELFRVYKYADGACLAQYKYSGYTEAISIDGLGMISWYAPAPAN